MTWAMSCNCALTAAFKTGWLYPWMAHHQDAMPSTSSLPSARVSLTPRAEATGNTGGGFVMDV